MNATLHKMVSGYLLSLNGDIDDPYAIVNEQLADDYGWYKLSLKNCESIERGYDLDKLAKTIFPDKIFTTNEEYEIPIDGFPYQWGFKVGFQKAIESMGGKMFTLEDMMNCWNKALTFQTHKETLGEHIQSLQQNKWDVEIEMEKVIDETKIIGAVKGVKGSGSKITTYKSVPKLDENGCLILKKI